MDRLPVDTFKLVVAHAPLVAMDLVVRDPAGRMLLGLRRNRPARDWWFAPGGRIRKDERLEEAFARITREELGTSLPMARARLLGVFEHLYDDNFSGDPGFGTHYVVIGCELRIEPGMLALPESQHSEYRWASDAEILASDRVHPNTQAYCDAAAPAFSATSLRPSSGS